jgi:hypothetical protein
MTLREMGRAMVAPASVFASPEQVLEDPELSNEQKIEVLLRWNTTLRKKPSLSRGANSERPIGSRQPTDALVGCL